MENGVAFSENEDSLNDAEIYFTVSPKRIEYQDITADVESIESYSSSSIGDRSFDDRRIMHIILENWLVRCIRFR